MGNENSSTTEKNPKTTAKPVLKKTPVQGSAYRNYQPSAQSSAIFTTPASMEKDSVINEERNSDSRIQLKSKASEEAVTSPHSKHTISPVSLQKPVSPVVMKQQIASPSHTIPSPNIVNSNSFEKAPMVQLNYVVRPSDDQSIHTYGQDDMTVMRRTSSQSVPYGNRWYDNGYNNNSKPLVVKYL